MRPAPYGDRLTTSRPAPAPPHPDDGSPRVRGDAVEAHDPRTGALRWRYARVGRRPLAVVPAGGRTVTLWDDGLVTGTDGSAVRWHRALPDASGWLAEQGGAGVLRPLGKGILAVVTPHRVTAYRTADGDLRWVLPAHPDCAFAPERAVRHTAALLLAQPCAEGAWTEQVVALDDLGRIAPDRTPLGNEPPSGRSEQAHVEKQLARPR
jgi:outer membrane protein assembly factor BamB